MDEINIVCDILFYDVSELIISKQIIYEENIIKQKILAKIAHEFKTTINSIIGLINDLKENITELENSNQNNSFILNSSDKIQNIEKFKINKNLKSLDVIQNLSKYIIFLVSDIIHYSSIKDINQINLMNDKVNLREISNFSLEILNCLIKCNKSKQENIKTELIFDDQIDDIILKIDEIRLKQIILNIISNSVKFTKSGKIIIMVNLDIKNKEITITISDTGIGIKDNDQNKLFQDFVMLDNGISLNNQGTGLGLSICKSLAYKMNIKLNFDSKYGDGTNFFIIIPIKLKNCMNNSFENRCFDKFKLSEEKVTEINNFKELFKSNSFSARENKKFENSSLVKVLFF